MKLLLRWISAALALIALLVITAAVVVISFDFSAVKSELLTLASQQIGRPLAVDGALSIKPGRTLQFTATGVRLGNAAWGSRPDMLRAGRLLVEVDAWSLIDHPVIVHRVEVDGFDLLLERTADGDNNWDFGNQDDDGSWLDSLPVIVEEITMPGAQLRFSGPRLDRPLDVRFDTLVQHRSADSMLTLTGTGQTNGEAIAINLQAGPFDALVAGRDFEISLDAQLGQLGLVSQARVDNLAKPVNTELTVQLQAPDADYLASRLGVRNLGTGPVALTASVTPAGTDGVQGTLSGKLGAFEVDARGELADPAAMQRLAVQLAVSGPDLSLLGGLAGMNALPADKFRLKAAVERNGEDLRIDGIDLDLLDSKLRLQGSVSHVSDMRGTDIEFQFSGSDVARFRRLLKIPGIAAGPFDVQGRARRAENGDELIDLQAKTEIALLKVSGPLGKYPDYYGTRLRFDASGSNLARIGSAIGITNLPPAAFRTSGQLVWTSKGVALSKSTLTAGDDRLTLDGRIGRQPLGPDTDVRFAASGRDFRHIGNVLGIVGAPAAAYDLQGRVRRDRNATRLSDLRGTVAGASLSLNGTVGDNPMRGTNVSFDTSGPALEAFAGLVPDYQLPAGRFSAGGGLELTTGKAAFRKLHVESGGARAQLDADVRLPLSNASGTFDIVARGPDLSRFLPTPDKARPLARSFDLKATGRAQGGQWNFSQLELTTDAGHVSLAGNLDWAPDFSATNLQLSVDVPNLAVAGQVMGLQLPAQPLRLSARFTGTPTAFEMQDFTGQLGPSDLAGRLVLDLQKKPRINLDIRSRLLDLTSLGGNSTAPAPAAATARTSGKRMIPDTPLPLGWLDDVDGRFAVTAARARIADSAFENLRLAGRLQSGNLYLDPLELSGPYGGQMVLKAEIDQAPPGFKVQLSGTARQIMLSPWTDTPAQAATRPRADLDLQLAGQGRTWRELAASLEGKLRIAGGAGDTPAAGIDKLLGGLWSSLVRTVRGSNVPATMRLRCFAVVATATSGVVATAPVLAFQTDSVNVISHGAVNLRDETLEFYLRTTPRDRFSINAGEIINPYVKIVGPLNNPGLGVDAKGTLFTAGTAFATGGLSLIAQSLWDRMFRASDPCAAALTEADKLAARPASSWPSWLPNPFGW